MKNKRIIAVVATFLMLVMLIPQQSFAWFHYDRDQVVSNAHEFAPGYYGAWPYFSKGDCTNYVSFCEYYKNGCGMVYNGVHDVDFTEWLSGISIQPKDNEWYAIRKKVKKCFITTTVWCASQSWTVVRELRKFNQNNNPDYCSSTVNSYSIKTDEDVNYLCSILQKGDIVQKESDHSIIITVCGSTKKDVKYCQHSGNYCDRVFSNFIKSCRDAGVYCVYVIHYS